MSVSDEQELKANIVQTQNKELSDYIIANIASYLTDSELLYNLKNVISKYNNPWLINLEERIISNKKLLDIFDGVYFDIIPNSEWMLKRSNGKQNTLEEIIYLKKYHIMIKIEEILDEYNNFTKIKKATLEEKIRQINNPYENIPNVFMFYGSNWSIYDLINKLIWYPISQFDKANLIRFHENIIFLCQISNFIISDTDAYESLVGIGDIHYYAESNIMPMNHVSSTKYDINVFLYP